MALLRSRVTPEQSARAGRSATAALVASSEFDAAQSLALFASMPDEISTRSLYELAIAAGKRCMFPRCLAQGGLEFAVVTAWEELEPQRFGVREPAPGLAAESLAPSDLMVVPGVAFDSGGRRLGRGRGYYDRFFDSLERPIPILFGFAFAFQLVPRVPVEDHDHLLDGVVTEDGLHRALEGPGPPGRQKSRDAF